MTKKAEARTEEQGFALISSCPYHFGYLSQRPKGQEIPSDCITCEKLTECMLSTLKSSPSKHGTKSEAQKAEQVKEPDEEPAEEAPRKDYEQMHLQESKAEPLIAEPSEDQFTVEDLGMLYASWSSTVRVHKERLEAWGKKIKEVEVENADGKRVRCKVQPMQDSDKRSVQVPDKVKRELKLVKGGRVRVKPVTKS